MTEPPILPIFRRFACASNRSTIRPFQRGSTIGIVGQNFDESELKKQKGNSKRKGEDFCHFSLDFLKLYKMDQVERNAMIFLVCCKS